MPEIIIEISLNRSSGVLAGIVASLAQAGIELQSQKLQRATEDRGAWLTITGTGDSPSPAMLAERLNGTRGVEKLMRIIVDGEAILAEGNTLEDQIQPGDLAELSAGSDSDSEQHDAADEQPAATSSAEEPATRSPSIEDLPILSEPEEPGARSESAPESENQPKAKVEDPVEQDLAAALGAADEASTADNPAPEFAADPTVDDDLSAALHDDVEIGEAKPESPAAEEASDPAHVGAVLRRRRRRRR